MDTFVHDQLAMTQAAEIWKHILPQQSLAQLQMIKPELSDDDRKNKRQKTKGQGKGAKQPQLPEVLQLLTRLVLRHEDSLNASLTESQFLIHFNLGGAASSASFSKPQPRGNSSRRRTLLCATAWPTR